MNAANRNLQPIAIVGTGCVLPGSRNPVEFWRHLVEGADLITEIPPHYWLPEDFHVEGTDDPDRIACIRGGFVPEVDFDPVAFGMPPRVVSSTDVLQLLALLAARQVVESVECLVSGKVDRGRVGVFMGAGATTQILLQLSARLQRPVFVQALRRAGIPEAKVQEACGHFLSTYPQWDENTFPGYLNSIIAGRIANRLDLRGANCSVDAACASSLAAFNLAIDELRLGRLDMVLAGGADATNDVAGFFSFDKTHALSRTGDCRPFAEDADGTLLGEGVAVVALRRLEDAERDGDAILAVVRNLGSSSDGKSRSIYAPSADGQAAAIRAAYEGLEFGLADIGLLETHGTGTAAGDRVEFEGLARALDGKRRDGNRRCAIGSVKSQIGHTKAAAGTASLIKTAMALRHGVLPPSIKVGTLNPRLKLDGSPFHVNTRTRPWIQEPGSARRAGLSAFGFGGSNFHMALEEYRGPGARAPRVHVSPVELFLLSEETPEALQVSTAHLARDAREGNFAARARATRLAFRHDVRYRLALVATGAEDLMDLCRRAMDRFLVRPGETFELMGRIHYRSGPAMGGLAWVFPGQGSQVVDMGSDVAVAFEEARSVWDRASVLAFDATRSLDQVVFPVPDRGLGYSEDPQGVLTRTEWAQPALGATSASMQAILAKAGIQASFLGGHSYGELAALHAAGAFGSLEDFLRVSRRRGELMRDAAASSSGAMTAVQADAPVLEALLTESVEADAGIANRNSPRQTVLSGTVEGIGRIETLLRARGIAFRRLPVACAFHSPHVASSAAPFAEFLAGMDVDAPKASVWSNLTGAQYPRTADAVRELLPAQLAGAVRFREMIESMHEAGARVFLEVGPGAVLTRLVDDILGEREHVAIAMDSKFRPGVAGVWNALGELSAAGIQVDYAALEDGVAVEFAEKPRELSSASLRIDGSLHVKTYPPRDRAMLHGPVPEPLLTETVTREVGAVEAAGRDPGVASQAEEAILEHVARAQRSYEQAMTESHLAFLRASEEAFRALRGEPGGEPHGGPVAAKRAVPSVDPAPRVPVPQPVPAEMVAAPAARKPAEEDVRTAIVRVVSEKTGYPVEMLDPDTELEAGFGIDSIKKVEILAALQEAVPAFADPDMERVGAVRTIADIVKLAEESVQRACMTESVASGGRPEAPIRLDRDAVGAILASVVSEKTGYPVEMLDPGTDLEAGLGIDSIKRLEIFLAVQERIPGLSEGDLDSLAGAKSIGDLADGIVRALEGSGDARPGSTAAAGGLRRFVAALEAAPEAAPGAVSVAGLEIAVVPDRGGAAQALARLLGEAGAAVRLVADPREAGARAVHLGALDLGRGARFEDCAAVSRSQFETAAAVARAQGEDRWFVTVQDTGGSFGLEGDAGEAAWASGAPGLVKCCAKEWSGSTLALALDVERGERGPEEIAKVVFDEILRAGSDREVCVSAAGDRRRPCVVEQPVSGVDAALPDGALVIASGCGRGVGSDCLVELCRGRRLDVRVLGRTELVDEPEFLRGASDDAALKRALHEEARRSGREAKPAEIAREASAILAAREIRSTLEAVRSLGSGAEYVAVDVTDAEAVRDALDAVRAEAGPVRVLLHAAGVLRDKLLREKTPEQFDAVFRTKVHGLRNLLDATRNDAIGHLACFSSLAARAGNRGQSDYAMANTILDKICCREKALRPSLRAKSIGWGPWDGGMVTPALKALFASRGIDVIPREAGARAFVDELLRGGDAVETATTGGSLGSV